MATASFPPELLGGTERVVLALAECYAAAGDEVVVVAGSHEDHGGEDLVTEDFGDRRRLYRIPRRGDECYGIDYTRPRITALFDRVLADERPDVVHVHHHSGLSWQLLRTAQARGIRTVWTVHDAWPTCARFFRLRPDGGECPQGADRAACVTCLNTDLLEDVGVAAAMLANRDRALRAEFAAADVCTTPSEFMAQCVQEHLPATSLWTSCSLSGWPRPVISSAG